jgi:hypothetical protein
MPLASLAFNCLTWLVLPVVLGLASRPSGGPSIGGHRLTTCPQDTPSYLLPPQRESWNSRAKEGQVLASSRHRRHRRTTEGVICARGVTRFGFAVSSVWPLWGVSSCWHQCASAGSVSSLALGGAIIGLHHQAPNQGKAKAKATPRQRQRQGKGKGQGKARPGKARPRT